MQTPSSVLAVAVLAVLVLAVQPVQAVLTRLASKENESMLLLLKRLLPRHPPPQRQQKAHTLGFARFRMQTKAILVCICVFAFLRLHKCGLFSFTRSCAGISQCCWQL